MSERVPAIRVTDPQSRDAAPTLPLSPQQDDLWDGEFRRPATPASRKGASSRPSSSQGITSPTKKLTSLSGNVAQQTNGQTSQAEETRHEVAAAMDPLSQHIMDRTHTGHLSPVNLRPSSPGAATDNKSTPERPSSNDIGSGPSPIRVDSGNKVAKTKEKGVSFLSRIIGTKKKEHIDIPDDRSEYSNHRPEGAQAQVFAQPVDNIEFNPTHPQPPAYIKVRARNKKTKDFDRLFLAQELRTGSTGHENVPSTPGGSRRRSSATSVSGLNTVWAMEFSRDGKYLATAGHDKIVRVWAVLASPEARHGEDRRDSTSTHASGPSNIRLSAQVFQSKPIREYTGHEATILDLSWSKNNFLLSSSMDKTVRLWHPSRPDFLCTFKHNDFVPSIAFHPKDDRFFLAGSLDCKLRLWSIPDKHVAYSCQTNDMITAVAFTPDGKHAMAGCLNGMCMFYETEGLKYQTQIHVRSAHGKNAKGSKITGIQAVQNTPHSSSGDVKLLISSNDSRVRIYNFRDKGLEIKFKGCENGSSQIRASITDDHKYICCGSEDNRAYIWPLQTDPNERRDKRPVESFQAHNTVVTCVCFAPSKTRQVLGKSEDPIYEVCNPPPVTLMSRAERAESQTSSRPPSLHTGGTPRPSMDRESSTHKRPEESAGQIARSTHNAGNIIVTADYTGMIKVFRQDCAFTKRRRADSNWDAGSGFMRRVGSMNINRSASMKTKGSNRSLRSGRDSSSSHLPHSGSDRILSWRQNINHPPNARNGSTTSKNGRSISPNLSSSQLSVQTRDKNGSLTPHNDSRPEIPHTAPLPQTRIPDLSSASTQQNPDPDHHKPLEVGRGFDDRDLRPTDTNPLMMIGEQSNLFWDLAESKRRAENARLAKREGSTDGGVNDGGESDRLGMPGTDRRSSRVSAISTLSIERSVGSGLSHDEGESEGESEYEDAKD